jgi:hypothetical protein
VALLRLPRSMPMLRPNTLIPVGVRPSYFLSQGTP